VRHRHLFLGIATSGLVALSAAGCGSSGASASGSKVVTVAYEDYGGDNQVGELMDKIMPTFEKEHPGWKVQLEPIAAPENDYYTKLDLMNKSASTQPDVLYEDTFLINSDVDAGYLAPLDSYVNSWSDWSDFYSAAKGAVTAVNGHVYGVPMETDARGLWYNKTLFAKAGLPVPWHPTTWAQVLSAAQTIKKKLPGVTPMEVYSGTPAGEATSMQGFEMLLYGTGETLYNHSDNKWVAPGSGFTAALNFIKTIYTSGLGPSPETELNPNIGNIVSQQWLPEGKLAIDLDGSWLPSTWISGGPRPWPQWSTTMGWTSMPTENGQGSDITTLSGGWALSIGTHAANKQMAWDLISLALNTQNATYYTEISGNLAVRTDVASQSSYLKEQADIPFWSGLIKYTNFRPAYAVYPDLSNDIQEATEEVMTGQQSPSQAASAYDRSLTSTVGSSAVQGG
jgi:multiple sugar transport system substrate-binding protein